jgi:hypothetical protein
MSWQEPESSTHDYYSVPGGERARIRAADVDRDHVAGILATAYGQGRLSRDEYDERLAVALSSRTYGDLDRLVGDLPIMHAPPGSPAAAPDSPLAGVNRLAMASIICGLAQFLIVPLAIPAIVLGHMAQKQIKRTGEQGAGLARAGLVLGWVLIILLVAYTVVGLAITAGTHGPMPAH